MMVIAGRIKHGELPQSALSEQLAGD